MRAKAAGKKPIFFQHSLLVSNALARIISVIITPFSKQKAAIFTLTGPA